MLLSLSGCAIGNNVPAGKLTSAVEGYHENLRELQSEDFTDPPDKTGTLLNPDGAVHTQLYLNGWDASAQWTSGFDAVLNDASKNCLGFTVKFE